MSDDNVHELAFLRREVTRLRERLTQRTAGLPTLLRRQGFTIYKKEPGDDLLLPAKKYLPPFYRMLHKYSFRLFLRDVIKHQDLFTLERVTRYSTPDVTRGYVDYLASVKLIHRAGGGYALRRPIRSFGSTLEWYIAELLEQEFGAEATWGVKFRRPKVGGDYDVLAKFEGALLYAEVKSSPPKQIYDSEITAFFDRVEDLAPAIAIFLMDTELRMKDKIVPMFEAELKRRFAYPLPMTRLERELFQVQDRTFIINAKESIAQNIGTVLSSYYKQHTP